jgi:hypothetical protein
MRRLLIGFILLLVTTIHAQTASIENWLVWLYLPEDGMLLFRGFYEQQQADESTDFLPVSFDRHLQIPEDARAFPKTVIVSDDASTLAYSIDTISPHSTENTAPSFAKLLVSEILSQGYDVYELRTFDSSTVSMAFHSTAAIRALGHTMYHPQQRLPALASQYPDRERMIAYAYQDISGGWRIEVYDMNNKQLLHQLDSAIYPELEADRIVVHRYQDDNVVFSTITNDEELLYQWSENDGTLLQLPSYLFQSNVSDYLPQSDEALQSDSHTLNYYSNQNANPLALYTGDNLALPRFVQAGERRVIRHSGISLTLLERDGTVLLPELNAGNITQIVDVPTGFVYVLDGGVFTTVSYYHTLVDEFLPESRLIWSDFDNAAPVEIIFVHRAAE